jgi:c-di-GMP-related signal transduction protein
VKATPEVLARMSELKQAGFKFALDDVIGQSEDVQKFTPLCDVIKVDIKDMQPGTLPALAKVLKNPKQKLLAEKVETVEEFQVHGARLRILPGLLLCAAGDFERQEDLAIADERAAPAGIAGP